MISQERNGRTYTYLYDGHGSVVGMADESGRVTDTYVYDAFGNLLKSTGRTANNYRYCGEQFDSTTGLYYLRARYMDTSTGRFISQDSYAGSVYDPVSLHKYLYANSNPVTYSDPSGYFSLGSVVCASTIGNMLFYSASSGMIALGMNLIRQLRNVQNGMQEYVKWSDAIADAIIAMLLGEFFFCAGTLAASLSSAAIYLALGGSSLIFFMMNCAAAQNDWNTGNRDLAALEFIFAATSVYGAKKCFDSAAAITSAKATAGSATNPSTNNKQTATEASGNNSPSDNVKTNSSKSKNLLLENNKQAAKNAVTELPENIQKSVKDFFKGGSNKYTDFSVIQNEDGSYLGSVDTI